MSETLATAPANNPLSVAAKQDVEEMVVQFETWFQRLQSDPELKLTTALGLKQLVWNGFRAGWNGRDRVTQS